MSDKLGRTLPEGDPPIGEAWELSARHDAASVVSGGPYAGKTLAGLWDSHREEVFGPGYREESFPLLIKTLDACDRLSVQVHPPAPIAPSLGGEPKNEMWYIAHAEPNAELYVGLKQGSTRESFEAAIREGAVEDEVHVIRPQAGDFIYIPSGRLHAIGAGLLIYEIQQSSDTTYRVFDWNRLGLDGTPRELHVDASLACIDFSDIEPGMDAPTPNENGETLTICEDFTVERRSYSAGECVTAPNLDRFAIVTVISGELESPSGKLTEGDFALLPRGCRSLKALTDDTRVLLTTRP